MRGDVTGKGKHDADHAAAQRGRGREHAAAPAPIDDTMLRDYLADALASEESARVEKALRDSAELRARLEDVRQNRADGQLHTLGAIWHRARLTCPSRQQLGSFLLDALDPDAGLVLDVPPRGGRVPVLPGQPRRSKGPIADRGRRSCLQDPPAPHPPVEPAPAERG